MAQLRKSYVEIRDALKAEGSFVRNSAWMFASSGISILIQFAFFTVLARIYSPAVYGVFGIFNVYATTLGNAATLGYHQAFVIPREERKFSALLRLTLWIAFFFSLLVSIVFLVGGRGILSLFSHEELGNWIHWIGPTTFLMALDRVTADWAIRNKEFRMQMWWSTSTTLAVKTFNVLYGWLVSATVSGLIYTNALQHILRIIVYAAFVLKNFGLHFRARFTRRELMDVAHEYKEFPIYIYWGNVINIFSNGLPAALLSPLGFATENIGFYTYSLIVLDLPIRMLGAGVQSVFLQKAAELVRERRHELAHHTWKVYKTLVLVSLLFSMIVYVWGEQLYRLLLDERWVVAGRAAEVLVIFYFFRMISSPLSSLFNILRKEKQFFIFQVILTVFRVCALGIGAYFTHDFIQLMLVYSIVNALVYFVFCIWIFRLIQVPSSKVFFFTLGAGTLCFGVGYLLKLFFHL